MVRIGNYSHQLPLVVFQAEGPSYCVGLDRQKASAVARLICASLAAAPCRADGRSEEKTSAGRWFIHRPALFHLLRERIQQHVDSDSECILPNITSALHRVLALHCTA
jgi:hypothetical protein